MMGFQRLLGIACEAAPAKGDKKNAARWSWEAGHFKSALGDILLERMFGPANADATGFGTALTTASVAANRPRVASERASCLANLPGLFADAAA